VSELRSYLNQPAIRLRGFSTEMRLHSDNEKKYVINDVIIYPPSKSKCLKTMPAFDASCTIRRWQVQPHSLDGKFPTSHQGIKLKWQVPAPGYRT